MKMVFARVNLTLWGRNVIRVRKERLGCKRIILTDVRLVFVLEDRRLVLKLVYIGVKFEVIGRGPF